MENAAGSVLFFIIVCMWSCNQAFLLETSFQMLLWKRHCLYKENFLNVIGLLTLLVSNMTAIAPDRRQSL